MWLRGAVETGNLERLALGVDFISLEKSGHSMTELISRQCLFYMDAMGSQLHDGRLLGTADAWCCETFVVRMTNRIGYSEAGQGPQLLSRLFRLWAVTAWHVALGEWQQFEAKVCLDGWLVPTRTIQSLSTVSVQDHIMAFVRRTTWHADCQ